MRQKFVTCCIALNFMLPVSLAEAGLFDEIKKGLEKVDNVTEVIETVTGEKQSQHPADAESEKEVPVENAKPTVPAKPTETTPTQPTQKPAAEKKLASYQSNGGSVDAQASGLPSELVFSDIPPVVLLLKYLPGQVSEDEWLQLTKMQIRQDRQSYHRLDAYEKSKKKNPNINYENPLYNPILFGRDILNDRQVNFLAPEKVDEYRSKLGKYASELPVRVQMQHYLRLQNLEYKDGLLYQKGTEYNNAHKLSSFNEIRPDEKLRLPPLGSSAVLKYWPAGKSSKYNPFPASANQYRMQGQMLMALDRSLLFPALAMEAAEAEALYQRPKCDNPSLSIAMINMSHQDPQYKEKMEKAEEEFQACMKLVQSMQSGLPLVYDIELQGMVDAGNNKIIKAKLLGAKLYHWRGNVIKSMPASGFAKGDDVWQEKIDSENAARLAEQEKQKQQQLQREKNTSKLVNADIVSLNLRMTMSAAEKKVRQRIDPTVVTAFSSKLDGDMRYLQDHRGFYNPAGNERFVLYRYSPTDERLVAILRVIDLPFGTVASEQEQGFPSALLKQLSGKYGEDFIKNRRGVFWSSSANQQGSCDLISSSTRNVNVIEGGRWDNKTFYALSPRNSIDFYNSNEARDSLNKVIDDCGPTVHARFEEERGEMAPKLYLALYDLGAYAEYLLGELDRKKPQQALPDLDL